MGNITNAFSLLFKSGSVKWDSRIKDKNVHSNLWIKYGDQKWTLFGPDRQQSNTTPPSQLQIIKGGCPDSASFEAKHII